MAYASSELSAPGRPRRRLARVARIGVLLALLGTGCTSGIVEVRTAASYAPPVQHLDGGQYEAGKAELKAGRFGHALQAFRKAMAVGDESVEALNGLAITYDRLGRFDLADRYYTRALALAPNSPETLNNLGYSLYSRGHRREALAVLESATRASHETRHVQAVGRNLAFVSRALGAADQARATRLGKRILRPQVDPVRWPRLRRLGLKTTLLETDESEWMASERDVIAARARQEVTPTRPGMAEGPTLFPAFESPMARPDWVAMPGHYVHQGIYARWLDAHRLRNELQRFGVAHLHLQSQGERVLYQVRVGPLADREEAVALRDRLIEEGHDAPSIVTIRRQ